MNYPIPGNSFAALTTFYADNTNILGQFIKYANASANITIDYSKLTPAVVINKISFLVDVGGKPRLLISSPSFTATTVAFALSQGIFGQTYTIEIIVSLADGTVRSDFLTIAIPDDSGNCCGQAFALSGQNQISQLSTDYLKFVNSAIQYFVSSTEPQNPNIMDQWFDTTNGLLYEFITNGASSYWVPFGNVSEVSTTVFKTFSLYYVVGPNPQQVFPLGTLDVFGNNYISNSASVLEVFSNGSRLMPDDGTGRGAYTLNIITNTINLLYPAGSGEIITINVCSTNAPPIQLTNQLKLEVCTVTGVNTLAPLLLTPDGNVIIVFLAGVAHITPDFTVSGNQITWTSAVFGFVPGDVVFCLYTHS